MMSVNPRLKKVNWLEESRQLLRAACTPHGIQASLINTDNYGAIFTRDAVMSGIAGLLLEDEIIIEGFKNTLYHLKELQGKEGQIASNFTVIEGKVAKVSFGTLSPKIDACTWYMVGVGMLLKEGRLDKDDFKESIQQTVSLLNALEYNGQHLIYVPKGGNWADEYIYEGYILYDQVLRVWGLSLLAPIYENEGWSDKSLAIVACLKEKYKDQESQFYHSSFYPGGVFKKFDLAAHALAGIIFEKDNSFFAQSLDWIINEFIEKNNLPPAFYPVIKDSDAEWATLRNYHLFAFKNMPHHYHNGGVWWIWVGWLSVALALWNKEGALIRLTETSFKFLDGLKKFDFEEYVSADELQLWGTKKLCYSATGIIFLSLAKDSFNFKKLKPKN